MLYALLVLTQSDDAVKQPEGTGVGAHDEMHSRVRELEEKVKDMERKVANLFMDNVALKTKLVASRKKEEQQQEEITSLDERLAQSLSAQVIMHLYSTSMVDILLIWILKCNYLVAIAG